MWAILLHRSVMQCSVVVWRVFTLCLISEVLSQWRWMRSWLQWCSPVCPAVQWSKAPRRGTSYQVNWFLLQITPCQTQSTLQTMLDKPLQTVYFKLNLISFLSSIFLEFGRLFVDIFALSNVFMLLIILFNYVHLIYFQWFCITHNPTNNWANL